MTGRDWADELYGRPSSVNWHLVFVAVAWVVVLTGMGLSIIVPAISEGIDDNEFVYVQGDPWPRSWKEAGRILREADERVGKTGVEL
jgi:hypothetical protein